MICPIIIIRTNKKLECAGKMEHKNKVFKNLINFIQGKERYAVLKIAPTSYDHSTALAAAFVCYFGQEKNILFRTSSVKDIEIYLSGALSGFWDGDSKSSNFKKRIKEAVKSRKISIDTINLSIDTINIRSQLATPHKLHGAIIYPAETFLAQDYIFKKCLSDLNRRNTEKIIFCTNMYEDNMNRLKKLNPVIMNEEETFSSEKTYVPINLSTSKNLEFSYF
jgi:hypothetical protein